MALLGTMMRLRRGDMNWFILVALVALLVLPGAGHAATLAAPLPVTSCEAILFWLQSDPVASMPVQNLGRSSRLLSLTHRTAEPSVDCDQKYIAALEPIAQISEHPSPELLHRPLSRPLPLLEYHEAAHRTGIRTNRRLN